MDAIKLLEQWVKEDRESRNSTESDFDEFCEERNVAIEEVLRLAAIGQATEKFFELNDNLSLVDFYMSDSEGDFEISNTDELLEWAEEDQNG